MVLVAGRCFGRLPSSSRPSDAAVAPLGPAGDGAAGRADAGGAAAGMKEDGRAGRGVGAGAALPQPSAGVHGERAAARPAPAPVPGPRRPRSPRRAPLPPAPPPASGSAPASRPPAVLPGRCARFRPVTCRPAGSAAAPPAPSASRALPALGWRPRRSRRWTVATPARVATPASWTGVRASTWQDLCGPSRTLAAGQARSRRSAAGSPASAEKPASAALPGIQSTLARAFRPLAVALQPHLMYEVPNLLFQVGRPAISEIQGLSQSLLCLGSDFLGESSFRGALLGACRCQGSGSRRGL